MRLKDPKATRVKYCLLTGTDWVLTDGDAKVMEEIVDRAETRELDEDGMIVCDGLRRFYSKDFEPDPEEPVERKTVRTFRKRKREA